MPILSDVDGVLFELFVLTAPPDANEGCDCPPSRDIIDGNNSSNASSGTPVQTDRLSIANVDVFHRHERYASTDARVKENATGGSSASVTADGDGLDSRVQNRDPSPSLFVGAVALLLSDFVECRREMESPLFDSAGGVAGTIKLVAEMLTGSDEGTQRTESTSRMRGEALAPTGGGQARMAAPSHEKNYVSSTTAPSALPRAEAGLASPFAVARLTSTDKGTAASPPQTRDASDRRREHGKSSESAPPCGGGRRDSSRRGRPGPEQRNFSEQLCLQRGTAAAKGEKGCPSVLANDEMVPRAVILYRGLSLPFRWFRSGTAREMDEVLRETLGEKYWCCGGKRLRCLPL